MSGLSPFQPEERVDAADMDATEYCAQFVDADAGELNFRRLWRDAAGRPRSERIRLLFDFDPFDYQASIINDPSPDVAVNCGRQVGKTDTGGAIAADAAVFKTAVTGYDIGFFGDVKGTAMEMFRRFKKHLNNSPLTLDQLGVADDNKTEWEFASGCRAFIQSLKTYDNIRGVNPSVVFVDEAALVEDEAIEEALEPFFLTHGDRHEFYEFSTPRGRSGYHYKANNPDQFPEFEHFSAHYVASTESPLTDERFIERKERQLDSLTFEQEYLGKFVDRGNAYIPSPMYRKNVGAVSPGHPKPGVTYYGGVDVATAGADRTVIVIITGGGEVVKIYNEDKSSITGIVGRIKAFHEEYGFETVLIDKNAAGEGVVDFSEEGLGSVIQPYAFSSKSKQKLYRRLRKDMEDAELTIPEHDSMYEETTALEFDYTSSGILKVGHRSGGHDDHPDSLSLANYARSGAGKKSVTWRDGASVGKV